MLACRAAKGFAIAAFVIAIDDPCWELLEKRRQARLAFHQRQPRDVLAVEMEQVKSEIGKVSASMISNEVTPSGRTPHGSPSI
jgi:hypothetical protein